MINSAKTSRFDAHKATAHQQYQQTPTVTRPVR